MKKSFIDVVSEAIDNQTLIITGMIAFGVILLQKEDLDVGIIGMVIMAFAKFLERVEPK